MTVPQLRAECKRLGLPQYQSKGKRLKKADLERQLAAHNGHIKAIESVKVKPIYEPLTQAQIYDLARIEHAQVSRMSVKQMEIFDDISMHRIMKDCATPAEHRHWDLRDKFISQVVANYPV